MPASLSKFTLDGESCVEYGHPWTESCWRAHLDVGSQGFYQSLRIYSIVYLIAFLMRGQKPSLDGLKKLILSILQSTAFLGSSTYTYATFICVLRKILGNYNVVTVSFLPSFLSSIISIFIERPSRRPLLCLYVTNIATETLFRMGVSRGYFKPIPYGNVYIFAAGMTTLLYLLRIKSSEDSIFKMIKFLADPYEHLDDVNNKVLSDNSRNSRINTNIKESKSLFNITWKSLKVYENIINWIKSFKKHALCPHPHSCAHFILTGGIKSFGVGYGIKLGLNLTFSFRKLINKPHVIKSIIFNKGNLKLALFLGGFSGIYRLITCSLRRIRSTNSEFHVIPAGLIASIAFSMYSNNTIALYFMWKALQLLWNKGVETKKLPECKFLVILMYSFSTAILFHAAIVEPQNLRLTYWNFLYSLSANRIACISRLPIDKFGLESSKQLNHILNVTDSTINWPLL